MAIKVGQAFERTSAQPIDASLTLTKAQMVTVNDNLMPPYYFTICQDDGKVYLYDKSATASASTGKFSEFSGGSGSGSPVYLSATLLDKDVNDPTIVALSNLTKADDSTIHPILSEIVLGTTVIYDADGTMGVATAKSGTNVTVTTATTSTPTKELTQAEYDALTEAEKNNGTIYFITDNYVGSTYVGALESIYSTTEHIIGSYMGKPLYQKIVDFGQIPSGRWPSSTAAMSSGLTNVEKFFIKSLYTTSGAILPYERVTIGESDGVSIVSCAYIENGTPVIKISTDTDRSGMGHVFGILQYTKTTDSASPVEYASPNDYSTSEKIVGTWIDGKPLYQRTYTATRASNVGHTPITHGLSFDYITVADAVIIADDKSLIFPLPNNWVSSDGTDGIEQSEIYITPTTMNIRVRNNEMTVPSTIYITVKYTKSTD